MTLDKKTLKALIKEAEARLKAAKKAFDKYDNDEDMHAIDTWATTATWLTMKLEGK